MPNPATDDFTIDGDTFRARAVNAKKIPIYVVGSDATPCLGVQSVAVTDGLTHTLAVPSGATRAEVTLEGLNNGDDYVRYWHGAPDPTSAVGVRLYDGQMILTLDPATITFVKGSTGGGGTLRVEYF